MEVQSILKVSIISHTGAPRPVEGTLFSRSPPGPSLMKCIIESNLDYAELTEFERAFDERIMEGYRRWQRFN